MMRSFALCAILVFTSVSVRAGDTQMPPGPPPCKDNCPSSATQSPMPIGVQILLALLGII